MASQLGVDVDWLSLVVVVIGCCCLPESKRHSFPFPSARFRTVDPKDPFKILLPKTLYADSNCWGPEARSTYYVGGRIRDESDNDTLLEIKYEPFVNSTQVRRIGITVNNIPSPREAICFFI